MGQAIQINPGEIIVKFDSPTQGKVSFQDLGIKPEDLVITSGFMRIVFNMDQIGDHNYFQVPTIEVTYTENLAETHWQCDFNGTTILDKLDHHGHSTVLLLNRKNLSEMEHHHENRLILHAEFPEGVHISGEDSYINFFK